MAKELSELFWVEELLPEGHLRKHIFGGFSYYVDEKLVLLMFEGSGSKVYRGKKHSFELWNGCMFPVDKEFQDQVFKDFSFLIPHPVLPKWLYLPLETEDFEGHVHALMRELRRKNPLFGTIPKSKGLKTKSKASRASTKKSSEAEENIDTRRPRMFSDQPSEEVLQKAKRLSELKNLGPETEKTLIKAGIKTPEKLIKLGWKKTMVELCKSNPKNNHSILAYAVIGALRNKLWNLIPEEDKAEARALMKSLREKKPIPKKARQPLANRTKKK